MVAIGLLQACGGVGSRQRDRGSVDGREAVVGLLGVTIGYHVGQREGLCAGSQLLLGLLFLLHLLMENGGERKVNPAERERAMKAGPH